MPKATVDGVAPSVNEFPLPPLREDEFLPFGELMKRLPDSVSKEAIRKLWREGLLPRHRLGRVTYIHVRELIVATRTGTGEDEGDDDE